MSDPPDSPNSKSPTKKKPSKWAVRESWKSREGHWRGKVETTAKDEDKPEPRPDVEPGRFGPERSFPGARALTCDQLPAALGTWPVDFGAAGGTTAIRKEYEKILPSSGVRR
jgi:hypothetical protein